MRQTCSISEAANFATEISPRRVPAAPRRIKARWFVALLAFTTGACDVLGVDCGRRAPEDQSSRVTISQGVWGEVVFSEGNLMPGAECPSGSIEPVRRTVLIYNETPRSKTQPGPAAGFFASVSTELVDSVVSDSRGFFEKTLPAGTYSVFVRENSLLYANSYAMPGEIINPVKIQQGQVARHRIDINYRAAY